MSQSLFALAAQFEQARNAFVLATIVWCERPTSAKPGAQAIIDANGHITGWIGGSCAQPVVIREALRALREGDEPYLLRLGTSHTTDVQQGVRVFPMTCSSGGALDIYIEPHLPLPRLLLIGDSPIVVALGKLATVLDFMVVPCDPMEIGQAEIDAHTFVVVATHGEYDEDVLEHVLRSPAIYVGMVASHRRADTCRATLQAAGLDEAQLIRLQAPAGLNVGAVTPEEIAASILAELVQVRRHAHTVSNVQSQLMSSEQTVSVVSGANSDNRGESEHAASGESSEGSESDTAIDPVCGMTVDIATARHRSTYDGRTFYFCCPACKRSFEREPQAYLSVGA